MSRVPIKATMIDMPSEILTDILKRVSPKDLLRCLCVLKSWNSLIRSKNFHKIHHLWSLETKAHRTVLVAGEQYIGKDITDFFTCEFYGRDAFSSAREITQPLIRCGGETRMVGCCNGLVCLITTFDYDIVCIWNPCIQKFKPLPPTPIEIPQGAVARSETNFGFGYFKDDYKVVRVFEYEIERDVVVGSEVKVYSLESDSWKKIESASCKWDSYGPISFQDALHWFGKVEPTSSGLRVLTLDFKTEMFKEFLTPFGDENDKSMAVLNGQLCIGDFLIQQVENKNLVQLDIWVMETYGLENWTRKYSIKEGVVGWTFGCCAPLASSRNGKRILLLDCSGSIDGNLFWYDTEKHTGDKVKIPGFPNDFDAAICVANLTLLDGVSVINGGEGYEQFEMSEGEGSGQDEMSEEEGSEEGEMSEGTKIQTE